MKRALLAMVLAGASPVADWKTTEKADPMTDRTHYAITLVGDNQSAIQFECDNAGPNSVAFFAYSGKGDFVGGGRRNILVRFDEDAPMQVFALHTDNAAMPDARKDTLYIAGRLLTAHKFAVRITDYRYNEHDYVFDVSGSSDPIQKLFRDCEGASPF